MFFTAALKSAFAGISQVNRAAVICRCLSSGSDDLWRSCGQRKYMKIKVHIHDLTTGMFLYLHTNKYVKYMCM